MAGVFVEAVLVEAVLVVLRNTLDPCRISKHDSTGCICKTGTDHVWVDEVVVDDVDVAELGGVRTTA